ncbi:MAG: PadR family transcriptional regulator [Gemmatimonadota bacterium]
MQRMVSDGSRPDALDGLLQEVRRGGIVLAVLGALGREEYGWSLRKELAERGLEIEEGTLYPLLRRLEDQRLLSSRWRVEDGRRRRYYRITEQGQRVRTRLASEWRDMNEVMEGLSG